jgi:DNA-binding response OmpR family regulator
VRILVVEDDDAIATPLERGLRRAGHDVERVVTGAEGLAAAPRADLVLLDLGLPDQDGSDVCRRLRATSQVPIIVVTARGDEVDRVVGLELGADDYLVKPFGFRELLARIGAVMRRANPAVAAGAPPGDAVARLGAVTLDRRSHRVHVGDDEVDLTPKEFDLLALLAEDPGAIRTRAEILERVWDPHWYGPTKTLDVHVASLRKKLRDPGLVETVRGVGFRLRVPG